MTKDEIREFITERFERHGVNDREVINEIVEKWEEDVHENRDEAFNNGIECERMNEMYPR